MHSYFQQRLLGQTLRYLINLHPSEKKKNEKYWAWCRKWNLPFLRHWNCSDYTKGLLMTLSRKIKKCQLLLISRTFFSNSFVVHWKLNNSFSHMLMISTVLFTLPQWQIISFWWNEFQDIIVSAHTEKKITHRTAEQHLDIYKWKLLGKLESLKPEMEKTIKSPSIFKEDLNLIPNHIIVNVKYFCCLWCGLQQA